MLFETNPSYECLKQAYYNNLPIKLKNVKDINKCLEAKTETITSLTTIVFPN